MATTARVVARDTVAVASASKDTMVVAVATVVALDSTGDGGGLEGYDGSGGALNG